MAERGPSRTEQLADELRRHRELYYAGQPEISDEEFDALEDRLRELDPDHAALREVGAPVKTESAPRGLEDAPLSTGELEALAEQLLAAGRAYYDGRETFPRKEYERIWFRIHAQAPEHAAIRMTVPPARADWPKARHEIPMGSLNKVNAKSELADWVARCDELGSELEIPPIAEDLAVTEKLDGISLELLYIDGRLDAAITRGDGETGERITANALAMKGVPHSIDHPGSVSARGEVVLRRSDAPAFAEAKKALDADFDGTLSLRNSAAGQARAKDPKYLPLCRFLSVLLYDVEGIANLPTERDKLALLARLGFASPRFEFGDLETVEKMFDAYEGGKRNTVDYEIDGLVVRANSVDAFNLLGELNNRPRAAVALKFPNEMKVSKLIEVRWETGPSGRITPVAIVEPVRLAGANIERASLHNRSNVERLNLGPGDDVLVSRRNDVIPYVEKVVVRGHEVPTTAPNQCSACDGPVSVEGEYLTCKNSECPARRIGRLKVWIRQLGLLEWGEKTLEKLYEVGLVKEVADLYRLKVEDITQLEGYGETTASKLLDPLWANKEIPIATFIAALGIEGVSLETAKLLVQNGYETFAAMKSASALELAALDGLGDIKADRIHQGLSARSEEVEALERVGVRAVTPAHGGPLAGLSFCFSGAASRPRKVLHQLVENNGGAVATGVKKGLAYLVLEDANSTSSKAEKARKLGTTIIDEATFDRMILERGGTLK